MKRLIIITIALSSLVAAAEKEKPLPKDLPPYGPLKPFVPPPVSEFKLDNGLTIWLAPVAGFPEVSLTVGVRGGLASDPKDRPGISQLLASTMTQGTKTRSARQIAEELQDCGGDLTARSATDNLTVRTSVLAEKAETAIVLLADVIQNAALSDSEVQLAKQKASSELDESESSPSFLARRALYRAMFGDHPYGTISATKDSIDKTTAGELRHEYSRRFRPDQSILVVVGDFNLKRMELFSRKVFGDWKNPETASDVSVPPPTPSVTKTVSFVARPNSVQTAFYIGGFAPKRTDPDYEATNLANSIYGGMFGSRLILNIREDKGYTYSPYSMIATRRQTGLIITSADVRNPVTGASYNEITYELNRMGTTSPEEEELERAKRYAIGSLAIDLQSQSSLAQTLAGYWIDSLSPQDLARESEKIEHVSANEIKDAGRKYFPMWRMTTVAVGEEKVIKEELSPFGLEFKKVQ